MQCLVLTVIFTTQPFEGPKEEPPANCLVIAKDGFDNYFGPVFSTHAGLRSYVGHESQLHGRQTSNP